jgi:hypothetical protein
MPVQKFRSLAEAGSTCRLQPGTVEFSRRLRAVFWMAAQFSPSRQIPPGVHKFRSIEESQTSKTAWNH